MTLYRGTLEKVYNSPVESYYVGKNIDVNARIAAKNDMYADIKR